MENKEVKEVEVIQGVKKKIGKRKITAVHISVISAVVALVVLFAVCTSIVYTSEPTSSVVRSITRIIPYPALVVNWSPTTIHQVLVQYDGLIQYFDSGQAASFGIEIPSEEKAFEDLIENLIFKKTTLQLLDQRGLEIDQSEIDQLLAQAVEQAGTTEALEQMIDESFGWNLDQFRQYTLFPLISARTLEEDILYDEEIQAEKRARIDQAYERVVAGEDFLQVALEVNEGGSATDGGHIGQIDLATLPPEWSEQIVELSQGGFTEVVETRHAYGILLVNGIEEQEGETIYDLYLIGVEKASVGAVILQYIETSRVWRLISL